MLPTTARDVNQTPPRSFGSSRSGSGVPSNSSTLSWFSGITGASSVADGDGEGNDDVSSGLFLQGQPDLEDGGDRLSRHYGHHPEPHALRPEPSVSGRLLGESGLLMHVPRMQHQPPTLPASSPEGQDGARVALGSGAKVRAGTGTAAGTTGTSGGNSIDVRAGATPGVDVGVGVGPRSLAHNQLSTPGRFVGFGSDGGLPHLRHASGGLHVAGDEPSPRHGRSPSAAGLPTSLTRQGTLSKNKPNTQASRARSAGILAALGLVGRSPRSPGPTPTGRPGADRELMADSPRVDPRSPVALQSATGFRYFRLLLYHFIAGIWRMLSSVYFARRRSKLLVLIATGILMFIVLQVRSLTELRDRQVSQYGPSILRWLSNGATREHEPGRNTRSVVLLDRVVDGHMPPRRLAGLDTYLHPKSCMNTKQGREKLADDRGRVCARQDVLRNGCCPPHADSTGSRPFSCDSCDATYQCCPEYERCVACCMRPDNRPLLLAMLEKGTHPAYLSASTPFSVCQFRCRTSSGSTVHQNAYRSVLRFCHGLLDSPAAEGSVGPDRDPDDAGAVAAKEGGEVALRGVPDTHATGVLIRRDRYLENIGPPFWPSESEHLRAKRSSRLPDSEDAVDATTVEEGGFDGMAKVPSKGSAGPRQRMRYGKDATQPPQDNPASHPVEIPGTAASEGL